MYLRLDFVAVEIVNVLKTGKKPIKWRILFNYLFIVFKNVHLIFQRNFTFLFYISCEF